ncbi:MAG: hypothetical protein AB7N54_06375 [Alphaproteobacteria bacterium]
MPARATRRRPVALAFAAAFIAGIPTLLLALTWLSVGEAVMFPETTCWRAGFDGKYLLTAEFTLGLMIFGFLPWLLLSALVLSALRLVSTFGVRFVVANLTVAAFSGALIYLGYSTAVRIEDQAFHSYAANCTPAVKAH